MCTRCTRYPEGFEWIEPYDDTIMLRQTIASGTQSFTGSVPIEVKRWANISYTLMLHLMTMNDGYKGHRKLCFLELADEIERRSVLYDTIGATESDDTPKEAQSP